MVSLKLNSSGSFLIYQLARFATSITINIILTKSFLTVSDIGKFESFIFYASAISFFWITGITEGFLTIYNSYHSKNSSSNPVIFNVAVLMMIFSLICSLIIVFGNIVVINPIIDGLSEPDIFLLAGYIFIYPTGFLIEFILLLKNKYKHLVFYGIFSTVVSIVIVSLPSLIKMGVVYCLYGLFLIALIKMVFLIIIIARFSLIQYNHNVIIDLIKTSMPLAGTTLIAGSLPYIDSFIVSQLFDSETFAIFRYGAKEFPLFLMMANAFSASMLPKFSAKENLNENLSIIKNKSGQYIRNFFPLAIFLLLISQYAFQNIFNRNFYESYYVFDIYMLLIISRFVFPATILIGLRKNNVILLASTTEFFINIISSLFFVWCFGYAGVAYGTLVAYLSEKIILGIYVRQKLKIRFSQYVPINDLILFSTLVILTFSIKLYLMGN